MSRRKKEYRSEMQLAGKNDLERLEVILDGTKDAFERLISEMKEAILEGRYSDLLVDDTGARLFGRMLREVMKKANSDFGVPVPKMHFIVAGRDLYKREAAVDLYLDELKGKLGDKKTLFVTEHVASGESLDRMAELLKKNEIHFDVAALTTYQTTITSEWRNDGYGIYQVQLPEDSEAFEGRIDRGSPSPGSIFYDEVSGNFPGVGVEGTGDLLEAVATKRDDNEQATIWAVRKMVEEAADEAYEKVFHPKDEEEA